MKRILAILLLATATAANAARLSANYNWYYGSYLENVTRYICICEDSRANIVAGIKVYNAHCFSLYYPRKPGHTYDLLFVTYARRLEYGDYIFNYHRWANIPDGNYTMTQSDICAFFSSGAGYDYYFPSDYPNEEYSAESARETREWMDRTFTVKRGTVLLIK